MLGKSLGKSYDTAWHMIFGICPRTSCTPKFWRMYAHVRMAILIERIFINSNFIRLWRHPIIVVAGKRNQNILLKDYTLSLNLCNTCFLLRYFIFGSTSKIHCFLCSEKKNLSIFINYTNDYLLFHFMHLTEIFFGGNWGNPPHSIEIVFFWGGASPHFYMLIVKKEHIFNRFPIFYNNFNMCFVHTFPWNLNILYINDHLMHHI